MSSSSGPKGCAPILLIRFAVVSSQSESCFSCWCCRSIKTSWSLEMFQNISYMNVVNSKGLSVKSDRFIFLAKGLSSKQVTTCSVSPYWPHADVPSESWADSSVPAPPSLHHQSAALQTTTHFLLWEPGPRCPDETLTPPCSPGQTTDMYMINISKILFCFERKLFSENATNCSKVTVKTFIWLQKTSISNKRCSFKLSIHKTKCISFYKNIIQHYFLTLIIRYVPWAPNQHFRMTSEGSCDSEVMMLKIQLCHHMNKLHFILYWIRKLI